METPTTTYTTEPAGPPWKWINQMGKKEDWPTIVNAQGTSISIAPRHYVVQLNYRNGQDRPPPYTISPRPFNNPTQTNYQLYPQLSESTGTFEELRFSFPNPNTTMERSSFCILQTFLPRSFGRHYSTIY
jgi:hypothetical protein